MKTLIDFLLQRDSAFYRCYLEMLLSLERNGALTPWQLSILLWRAKLFHVLITRPETFRVSICTEQEKDEVRFMKGWKFGIMKTYLHPWQVKQCEEIRKERWR